MIRHAPRPFAGDHVALVHLDQDHPGFHDPAYRARRDQIASLALGYRDPDPIPSVDYLPEEQEVWQAVWARLADLHARLACRAYREGAEAVAFDPGRIPSFAELNAVLAPLQGFTLVPVAGLVTPAVFLRELAERRFVATQYMRHASRPLYTPEPDVVHEYVGHAPHLAHEALADLNRAFGDAAARARHEATVERIIRVYWYTVEFGLVVEDGAPKAIGAGLLSSFGELGRCTTEPALVPWDLERVAATPYDPTRYQDALFVAPSFDAFRDDLLRWLDAPGGQ